MKKLYNEYNEVVEILRYIPREDFNKIPKDMLKMFNENRNPNYSFKYNPSKTLKDQNVSKEARLIIAVLFKNYWATEKQRMKIINKQEYDLEKLENEKREIYNPDSIFKNKDNSENDYQGNEKETALVEYKENFFTKLKKYIMNFFK